jgi:hypothetical protein
MKSMKVWRASIANLLVVLLLTTVSGSGGPVVSGRTISAAQEAGDESKMTAAEEQEAREMVERFIRRMQETGDIAPLIGELFVSDYAARLQQEALAMPLPMLSRSAVEQASREELVRYQLAFNNSLYVAGQLFLNYKTSHPAEDDVDEWGAAYYTRMLLPDIIELCKADPVLKMLFEEDTPGRAGENRPEASSPEASGVIDHDDEPIRTVEQLRSFTSTLEQAIALARRHIAASPVKPSLIERHKGANDEANWTAEREAMKPRVWLMLNRDSYGYPKGTRIICVNALIYHMDLIRVDGELKVLALYLDMD